MALRMLAYGMCAGFAFLLTMMLAEWWLATRPEGPAMRRGAGGSDADVSEQIWAVLAEVRRITEEA